MVRCKECIPRCRDLGSMGRNSSKKSVGRAKVVRVGISSFQTSKAIKKSDRAKTIIKAFQQKAHDRK
jgi:hypothetical protein